MEKHWWKDHEILIVSKTEESAPRTSLDQDVQYLREILKDVRLQNLRDCEEVVTLKDLLLADEPLDMENTWDTFFANISNCHMYQENGDEIIQNLLDDMYTLNVTSVENYGLDNKGTQIKLKLTFENGRHAMFKPMRFDINYESDPNQFYFSELERPNAEIVAFYLDKLLGFRRGVHEVKNCLKSARKTRRRVFMNTFNKKQE